MSKDCVYCANETFALDPSTQKERLYCNHYTDYIKSDGVSPPCRNQSNCKGFREAPDQADDLFNDCFGEQQDKDIELDFER